MHAHPKSLIIRYLHCLLAVASALLFTPVIRAADEAPEYTRFYQPAKGFKPAQTSLTDAFLQLAGSLEHHGSPEPYIRHILAEQSRISALYRKKTGKEPSGRLPAHFTAAYTERLIGNWKTLSPKLGLDSFAKDSGRCTREAIRGTRDTGTIVIESFNEHQKAVIKGMKSGSMKGADFEALRARLAGELEFDKPKIDLSGYETARRDAVSYAIVFRGVRKELFGKLDAALTPKDSEQVKAVIDSIFLDLGRLAQAEFELAMLEWALR